MSRCKTIDPPYNLGTDDFRYSDKRFHDPDADDSDAVYVKNEDGGRHTKWLNFMAPRLYMLWEMLHDSNGVVFVSINDIELFRLGMLMNEVFGEDNHVGTLIWKGSTDNNPTRIATEHEYILCYAKNKGRLPSPWLSKQSDAKDRMLAAYEQIKTETFDSAVIQQRFRAFVRENKDTLQPLTHYTLVDEQGPYTGSRKVHKPVSGGYFYDIIHPVTGKPCKMPARGYRYPQETMQKLLDAKQILFGKDEKQIVQIKVYLKDYISSLKSVITNIDSRTGANALATLFGDDNVFRNPKPVELMKLILDYTTGPNSLVLDAFAGSGTTGHAVLDLNKQDGGRRRFIMIEEGRPGDKFARSLTAERIKCAIEKYGYEDGFTFYRSGRKLDRQAIVGLKRDALATLICQADETGRGRGITRVTGYQYIIGKNHRNEAICLVWNGENDSEVTKDDYRKAAQEVKAAGLKKPLRMYGGFTYVADTASWVFRQIPDEILAQMHIQDDMEPEALEAAG